MQAYANAIDRYTIVTTRFDEVMNNVDLAKKQ
jgi:hypothetical protein